MAIAFLSEAEQQAIRAEIAHYDSPRAASIDALKIVQSHRGWVPDEAIPAIAALLEISSVDVEGVATFYSQIFRQQVGRHVIRLCDSMSCFINGHETLLAQLQEILGIDAGQTTPDGRFTLLPVCCLGHCDKGPAFMIDDDIHGVSSLFPEGDDGGPLRDGDGGTEHGVRDVKVALMRLLEEYV